MTRKHKQKALEKIYRIIEIYPGLRPGRIARLLGEPRSQVARRLPALEEHGFLLSEDDQGRLWPFRIPKSN